MGWKMPWYTITGQLRPPTSAWTKWHGPQCIHPRTATRLFRTYLINGRGDEAMGTTWSYLDITPLGRQETWGGLAEGLPPDPRRTSGGNWHDNYDNPRPRLNPTWVEVSDAGEAAFPKARRRGDLGPNGASISFRACP